MRLHVWRATERASADAHRRFYNVDDPRRWGREHVPHEGLAKLGTPDGVVLEVGCGSGPLPLPNATAVVVDIAFPALARLDAARAVQCDAQALPFRSGSVAEYVTIAALEHVPDPGQALAEMHRVLRPGGVAYLAPAWNCRKWTATGVTIRKYSELPWSLRLLKASLIVREKLWWRAALAVPGRVSRELKARRSVPEPLEFRPLTPNLEEYLVSDSDAWASIDPQAVVTFLRQRGYDVRSHPGLFRRLTARHDPVVAAKAGRPTTA